MAEYILLVGSGSLRTQMGVILTGFADQPLLNLLDW